MLNQSCSRNSEDALHEEILKNEGCRQAKSATECPQARMTSILRCTIALLEHKRDGRRFMAWTTSTLCFRRSCTISSYASTFPAKTRPSRCTTSGQASFQIAPSAGTHPGGGGLDLRPGLAQCIFRHNPPQNLTSPRGAESATHLIIRITRATSYDASAGFFRRAYGQAVASSFLLHIAHSGNLMVRNEQQRQGWPGPSD